MVTGIEFRFLLGMMGMKPDVYGVIYFYFVNVCDGWLVFKYLSGSHYIRGHAAQIMLNMYPNIRGDAVQIFAFA